MPYRGKNFKTAQFMVGYGSSVSNASRKSGLGLRRIKVLKKTMVKLVLV